MSALEEERKFIEELILGNGFSLREMSIKIGKKESYLQQYVKYGRPSKLSDKDKEKILEMARGRKRKANMTPEEAALESGIWPFGGSGEIKSVVFNRLGETKTFAFTKCVGLTLKHKFLPFNKQGKYVGVFVCSSNMRTLICFGDVVICDCNVTYYLGDGIYVIEDNDNYILKYVEFNKKEGLLHLYDNTDEEYSSDVYTSFHFLGVWFRF